jgi:hypothetical protein
VASAELYERSGFAGKPRSADRCLRTSGSNVIIPLERKMMRDRRRNGVSSVHASSKGSAAMHCSPQIPNPKPQARKAAGRVHAAVAVHQSCRRPSQQGPILFATVTIHAQAVRACKSPVVAWERDRGAIRGWCTIRGRLTSERLPDGRPHTWNNVPSCSGGRDRMYIRGCTYKRTAQVRMGFLRGRCVSAVVIRRDPQRDR